MPLPTETLAHTEVLDFRDKAFIEYFTNENYLKMIDNKFGSQVVEHLKEMTAHDLPRIHRTKKT